MAEQLHHGGLHWLLWRQTTDGDRSVRIRQAELARELAVSAPTLCKTLDALEREGRVRNITGGAGTAPGGGRAGKLFEVLDPASFA